MNRRRLFSGCAALVFLVLGCAPASPDAQASPGSAAAAAQRRQDARLTVPADGVIPVAFLISSGATVIDFTGPWEVFQDASGSGGARFELFTVAQSRDPISASGGLQIVPDYTFDDAPAAKVIVVPAQSTSPQMIKWLRSTSAKADLTMSVCTGAMVLAKAGLLKGRTATTHHEYYSGLEALDPTITVRRNVRYVEGPRIATAGGLTSGIDLALRVVERYFGHDAAQRTAFYMEHTSTGWHEDAAGVWDASPARPVSTP